MNKKTNTVLFMLGATVVNVILMVAIFVLLFWLYGTFIGPRVSPTVTSYLLIVLFVGSIALTYFIYHRIVKWISNKWNLDDYFDPIFKRRGGPRKQ
jgi:Kef-type K+ transport system membrane component KefB